MSAYEIVISASLVGLACIIAHAVWNERHARRVAALPPPAVQAEDAEDDRLPNSDTVWAAKWGPIGYIPRVLGRREGLPLDPVMIPRN